MLRLYDYPQCPFCRKVRIALAEKGIKYEKVLVGLRKKEQKNKDFLKLNPYGKVPVIVAERLQDMRNGQKMNCIKRPKM
jgi:glutathione S-transferase